MSIVRRLHIVLTETASSSVTEYTVGSRFSVSGYGIQECKELYQSKKLWITALFHEIASCLPYGDVHFRMIGNGR